MRARQAAPIYFISTLIKRKLIATSLIMLQAAFDDANGKTQKQDAKAQREWELDLDVQETAHSSNDENKQAFPTKAFLETCYNTATQDSG